jgi:AcrR family transcriptional regulator
MSLTINLPEAAEQPDPILDAAYATILDFGLSKATVSEVAKRAGLSRMTVYRRYRDGQSLIRALMTRRVAGRLQRAEREAAAAADGLGRAVTLVVRTVELITEDPLLLRLLELEPELLLPYATQRAGQFQEIARAKLAELIAAGQEERSIRAGDPSLLAATIELACRGLVYAVRTLDAEQRKDSLAQLRLLVEGYLRPAR